MGQAVKHKEQTMPKRQDKAKTYPVEVDGRETRVTVPVSDEPNALHDWLADNLSPQATATIVAYLQSASTNDADVDVQVAWFAEQLAEALGGYEARSRLAEEVGL